MGFVYLPTWMVDFYGFHVVKYTMLRGSYGKQSKKYLQIQGVQTEWHEDISPLLWLVDITLFLHQLRKGITQLMINCWFGLFVWDSRGTPK